jgi:hypothetical protein
VASGIATYEMQQKRKQNATMQNDQEAYELELLTLTPAELQLREKGCRDDLWRSSTRWQR